MMDEILSFFSGILIAVFPGFSSEVDSSFSGYVEADYVYVAPTATGRIDGIFASENQSISAGDILFTQNREQQMAALLATSSAAEALKAAADNIRTGAREEELAVVRAQLEMALANQTLSQISLDRDLQLLNDGFVTAAKIDQERAGLASTTSQVNQLKAQLVSMELPARSAELIKAESNLQAALAEASAAEARLDAQTTFSPVSGTVERVLYSVGEVVMISAPVFSILPNGPNAVIFYIPETQLAGFEIGDSLLLSCDGCPAGKLAVLERIDSEPEFTPPIIYSRDERSRLVFRAKARLPEGVSLNPGQPVSLESLK